MTRYTKKTGLAVSDRSGIWYPRKEMVIEEGTGYLVHKSESDGRFNAVTHPSNTKIRTRSLGPEGTVVANARPPEPQENPVLATEDGRELAIQLMFGIVDNIAVEE